MWGKKLPESLASFGKHPIVYAALGGDTKGWAAAYETTFAVVYQDADSSHVTRDFSWSDCEGASWDDGTQTVTFRFVDNTQPPLHVTLADDEKAQLALVVRERVERSIVYQEDAELPSGAHARGLVRRDRDEALFTQVIVEGVSTPADDSRLGELEASLRDVTGMPQES